MAPQIAGRWIGEFDAELAREFFGGFAGAALCNLHLEVRYGQNAHHMVEALFKAFARAMRAAVQVDPAVSGVPSTKGTLTA
jgi:imidazoleglycerol-phosphate dehydratase